MGDGNFRPPTDSTPLDRSPKNLLLVITSATPTAVPDLVQIRPRGASGQMGEIMVKGKGSPYSITERRVPELIPVHGSQPAGDVSHKPCGRLPLLSASYPRNP